MRTAIATVTATVLAAGFTAAAPAKTSHEGWPKINGRTYINKHDRNKTVHGTDRSDELLGGHHDDELHGGAAADVIWGDYKGSGQTTTQHDRLYGEDGNDFIYASHGFNRIEAGPGDDYVKAHFGHGIIDCGPGSDKLYISHKAQKHYTIRNCDLISHRSLGF